MNQIETLHRLNIRPVEIITKIYETEKGTKETDMELDNLKIMFKEVAEAYTVQLHDLNAEMVKLKELKEKLNSICKEMEML